MKKHSPLVISCAVLLIITIVLHLINLQKTNGVVSYPLDDTFIHMAVAKNILINKVWGISAGEWVSSSSSPLYTIILTLAFAIFGIKEILPLIIGTLGSILAIFFMYRELLRYHLLTNIAKTSIIIIAMILGGLPSLSILGMEHTLQIAFTLAFITSASSMLSNVNYERRNIILLSLVAALMVFTRYENVFMVFIVCVILLLQKRILTAFYIGAVVLLPVIVFGYILYSKGSYPIPNSILLKANNGTKSLIEGEQSILGLTKTISGLLLISIVLIVNKLQKNKYDRDYFLLLIFCCTGIFHSLFASFGSYFRYEAYLIVIGSFIFSRMVFENFNSSWMRSKSIILTGLIFLLLISNLPIRAVAMLYNNHRATYNIYEQQYQMGKFVKQYYNNQTVAVNDIGAVAYLAEVNTIDLMGLANNEITKARKNHTISIPFLEELVAKNGTSLAIIYDDWFDSFKGMPQSWIKVGSWEIPDNYICGGSKVSFYSLNPSETVKLRKNLESYSTQLPPKIDIKYYLK